MDSQEMIFVWVGAAGFAGFILGGLFTWLALSVRHAQGTEDLKVKIARLQAELRTEVEKQAWLAAAQGQMRDAFDALSSKALESSSEQLVQRSREQTENLLNQARGDWVTQKTEIQGLVTPLQENLKNLDQQVRALEEKREGAYKGLEEQLRQLSTTHAELQNTTLTLSQALKSPTVRGRWGELQLRRVVEMAGMVRHVSYDEQVSGDQGRPDLITYLPNGGILPIDSKVPLDSYMAAVESSEESARGTHLAAHARAVKNRVRELSQRKYWDQFDETPEYVVMFIPNDAVLGAAFEVDPGLFEYAIEQKVLITTPVTLLALLKAVAYGWQQNTLAENAREIANQGRELYKRFGVFVDHLENLRKSLNAAVLFYNRAVGSLESRLFPATRRLKELGLSQEDVTPPEAIDTQARVLSDPDDGE